MSTVPEWISHRPTLAHNDDTGWCRNNLSPNLLLLNAKTLRVCQPHSPESCVTDGAICNRGFCKGKHVFAFMWPRDQRFSPEASICLGIGYHTTQVHEDFEMYLVGGNKTSIGFDLVGNTLVFNGKLVTSYPPNAAPDFCFPTLFYMYLDMDSKQISFGTEEQKWGVLCEFQSFRTSDTQPVFPMVAFRNVTGKFMMFYKGEGRLRR